MEPTRTSNIRRQVIAFACAFAMLLGMGTFAGVAPSSAKSGSGAAKPGQLRGNPTNKRLATEFLRLLKHKDKAGLRRFFDPAFLLQRGDGSYLNKKQYLTNPSKVHSFRVRNIVATRRGNVRVLRYEANTVQITNGKPVPGGWVPRLSTFVKSGGAWRLISHANFLLPPT